MSRILYGVQGEGRGHATRSLRILSELAHEGHEVLVLTGGDALPVLRSAFGDRVREIPILRFHYNSRGALCPWRTLLRNIVPWMRVNLRNVPLENELRRFRPDAAISDFEPLTCRLARILNVPLLSVNHQHFLTETVLPRLQGGWHSFKLIAYRWGTRFISGWPRRIIVSSFHHFPKKPGSRAIFVGPFLPEEIRNLPVQEGEVVTVYLRRSQYLRFLLPMLTAFPNQPFEIFSSWPEEGNPLRVPGHIKLRSISREGFLTSLAQSRALITTAGNQVLGEAICLGKPVLAMPEAGVLEQDLNAAALEGSGCGMICSLRELRPETWNRFESGREGFLRGIEEFRLRHPHYDGLAATLRVIHRLVRKTYRVPGTVRRPEPLPVFS